MTATEKQITVKPFYKDFDYFTDGFWALARLHQTFRELFAGVNVPKAPKEWKTGWMDIELAAQTAVFGSLIARPYYTGPNSPNGSPLPILGLNTFEYKSRTGAVHFKMEFRENEELQRQYWRFTIFPGNLGDDSLMNFKQCFWDAGWRESDDLNQAFSDIVRDARRM